MLPTVCGCDTAELQSAPVAEQLLMWVSDHMPRNAERVLATARAKYDTVLV
jgi:hypothetical protein